ncbi:MAG TPA: NUDIX domain-containing protein [Nocardioidaceae bacterium]|nr:NUDIX domain-containing protein [Nocardioidaceae bacterium]
MSPGTPRPVVGAAIVVDGRLLAARRTEPPALAGGWELPGGKVDPGETPEQACVREVREELGCQIEVGRLLEGRQRLTEDLVLQVYTCRLVDGEPDPRLLEHDALRWLGPEELEEVRWLSADEPFLGQLREIIAAGAPLPGGNVGGAVRIGQTVRRPTGPWSASVHALLDHLAARRLDAVPRVLGTDARGREVLTYLPGEVVYTPEQPMADAQLQSLVRWLRRYHEAVADFRPPPGAQWRFGGGQPADGQVICHHDVAWYNVVFAAGEVAGVIDWDVAGPGVPLDDLAFLAWNDVPLVWMADDAARRLRLMAEAYGGIDAVQLLRHVPVRIERSRRIISAGAEADHPGMRRLASTGVLDKIDRGLTELRRQLPRLEEQLR